MKILAGFFLLLSFVANAKANGEISIQNSLCSATFDPATLEVHFQPTDKPAVLLSLGQTNLGKVANLNRSVTKASWRFSERKVSVTLELNDDSLSAHVLADEPGDFTFPVIPETDSAKGWILPMFEGVYVPRGDLHWTAFLKKYGEMNTTADLTMPFVGVDCGGFTLTCILTNAFNNRLQFQASADQQLQAALTHQFTRNHAVKEYGVVFQVGTNSPVEPAKRYRDWLIKRGEFVSFKEKIQKTPEAEKLLGAAHAYLWGQELLHHTDVQDWKAFTKELESKGKASTNSPAGRVWFLMKPEAKKAVKALIKSDWPDKYTKTQVTDDLNRLLLQPGFYDKSAWSGVLLDQEVSDLLKTDKSKLNQAEVCRVNCHLLAAAFPNLLSPPESWGNGVSPKMIKALVDAGLDRMWLGSDSWDGFVARPETVDAARKAGFLIGPYDSFNGIHRPNEPDTWETSQFDAGLYEIGAIVNADGTQRRGFKRKGFMLSPDAARPYVEKRVTNLMNTFHANSWFIDCDGFGEYFDDYSAQHPATQQSDMRARISRMAWIRDTFGVVIGTEGCSAGVASTVHFAHGVMTPVIGWGDPDLNDKNSKYYSGSYYPPDEPRNQFMPVPIKEEYRYLYFEPRFRLPLFQTVFHDSVIATHHWSYGSFKTKDHAKTVELMELLYNVPPLYHLNLQELQKRKQQIKRHYDFFSPWHRQTALLPMSDFKWLTPDHSVQLTGFGKDIDCIANFGTRDFQFENLAVGPGSIVTRNRIGGKIETFTP